jgi:uncharacterized protein with von Willebrand factor type A (vWA) domain
MSETLTLDRIAMLGRRLRAAGLDVTPDVIADMGRAIDIVGFSNPAMFFWAVQAVVVNDRAQLPMFEKVFLDFFGLVGEPDHTTTLIQEKTVLSALSLGGSNEGERDEEEVVVQVGASAVEALARRDFADLTAPEVLEVRRMIAQMAWHPPLRASRRRRQAPTGDRPNLRKTFRSLLGPEGDLMPLEWTTPKRYRRPVVLIADISGSMESYAEMFLVFAHAARQRFGQVETFVFSTKLTRITEDLQRRSVGAALRGVTESVDDWSGGTKIGKAFQSFNREWSRRVTRGGPYCIILSDGWDCGEPELLRREMGRLSRSMKRTIWLNPLASREEYSPETRGMKAVLRYVDDFLPAASVEDLHGVVRLLDRLEETR